MKLIVRQFPSHPTAEAILFELHFDGEGLEVGEEAEVSVAGFVLWALLIPLSAV